MKFFLGKDEDEKNDSDSDSEVCTKGTKLTSLVLVWDDARTDYQMTF